MPRYMTSFSYTSETWADLISDPQDRGAAVGKLVEALGGRLIDIYYSMGDQDGFIITELPDDAAAAAAAIVAASAAHVKSVKTTKLFTMDEMMGVMAQAAELSIDAPGG